MEKCAQSMLQFSVWLHSSHLESWDTTFTSFEWLRCMMMDSIFRCLARHLSASSSEMRPSVSGLPMNLDDLWPYTSHLRARVRNNIKTIWNTSPHPMAGPLVVGGERGSVASQVPTLVGDLAGEAESQRPGVLLLFIETSQHPDREGGFVQIRRSAQSWM